MSVGTKQKGNRMYWMMLVAVLFALLCPLIANAEIQITIYGYGGVTIIPPAICPKHSTDKCAEIRILNWGSSVGTAIDLLGNQYRVVFAEPIPGFATQIQGADLRLESIEPIE
ncbi:MAG: hypothetical protein WHU95_00015 [candidate division WOR-3 bacterium]|jgi:uncharacterized ion transporter superfamily protein YfcC|nr:hypothetical protein [candidate division WOR-3 bacterium]MDH7519766.1 hypothetical protein [bacterium]